MMGTVKKARKDKATFQEQERLRLTRLWELWKEIMGAMGSIASCFDHLIHGKQTHVATNETLEILEGALDLINQAGTTLRKKPDLRVMN